ncbi:MAG: precorrin-2 C(20)-methyltransferase [Deltaproteobacteria bacterium]|nr:precorrin-2 C(20)-methyltransferase [Deltaproteobacteria bacterium]
MQATLYIIGIGPGDPDLLTIKALNVLRHCPVIATPKASQHGHSTALSIVQQALPAGEIDGKEIVELHFPMKKIHLGQEPDPEVLQAWQDAAGKIFTILSQGRDVAFPTLGDPAIYSTGYYLYATMIEMHPEVRVQFVPGISAMSSCSATTRTPICLGDDMLAVIPATFSDSRLRQILENFDTIVLMKVHRVMDNLIGLLRDLNLLDKATLVERVGMADERVLGDLSAIDGQVHYFSTIIVRKK